MMRRRPKLQITGKTMNQEEIIREKAIQKEPYCPTCNKTIEKDILSFCLDITRHVIDCKDGSVVYREVVTA